MTSTIKPLRLLPQTPLSQNKKHPSLLTLNPLKLHPTNNITSFNTTNPFANLFHHNTLTLHTPNRTHSACAVESTATR